MNTERLYYSQGGLAETSARIVSIEGGAASPSLALDRTIFFPGGGGQPADRGLVAGVEVAALSEREGLVLHRLSGPLPQGLAAGAEVRIAIDGRWRREYVERHTGQHLLSATFLRLLGAATKSVHHGPEFSTIDFDCPEVAAGDVEACEGEANRIIADDYRVITHLCPPEDLDSFDLRRVPPRDKGVVRVVEIDGIDFTPCCGVHAPSSSYLRLLKIIGAERSKGLLRIAFLVGGRAVDNYDKLFDAASGAAKALGVAIGGISDESERLLARCAGLERGKAGLIKEWARREAELAIAEAKGKGASFALVISSSGEKCLAEAAAKAVAEGGMIGLAASEADLTAHAAAPSVEARLGALLGPLARESGGKGGGGPTLFRASFENTRYLGEFIEKASLALSKL